MRLLKILMVGFMIFSFGKVANALPVYGRPVVGIGSTIPAVPDFPAKEGDSYFDPGTGEILFYIPLSQDNSGIFGVDAVEGGNTAGTFADRGGGTDIGTTALTMYLLFSPVADPAVTASLTFTFTDLDLEGVNDPSGFFESVQFYAGDGSAMSSLITTNGQSPVAGDLDFSVSGNSEFQTITFPDITSLVGDPFFVDLRFSSDYGCREGRNTPEFLIAKLESTPVPEPATLLLLGSALGGLALFGRKRLKK